MKIGRRTSRLAVPKEYLMGLIDKLHRRGLGCRAIASLTGYSETLIWKYARDLGRPRHTVRTISQAIIVNLPADLAADCLRIRIKSEAAHARGNAKAMGVCVALSEHDLVDDDDDPCVNQNSESTRTPVGNASAAEV